MTQAFNGHWRRKLAMAIPKQEVGPNNVHTQIHTKIFRKLALQSKTWCRRMNLKVRSYCPWFPCPPENGPITIATFMSGQGVANMPSG